MECKELKEVIRGLDLLSYSHQVEEELYEIDCKLMEHFEFNTYPAIISTDINNLKNTLSKAIKQLEDIQNDLEENSVLDREIIISLRGKQ